MKRNKLIVWSLAILLLLSSYLNYRQFKEINYYNAQRMNDARYIYVNAHSKAKAITDFGYSALATNNGTSEDVMFKLIVDANSSLRETLRQPVDKYYVKFEVLKIIEGLNALTREVMDEVSRNGWTDELRDEFEGYLIAYHHISQYFRNVLNLDFNRDYFNNIYEIETNITNEFNKYIDYHILRNSNSQVYEENNRQEENFINYQEIPRETMNNFAAEAVEFAKEHMGRLIPDYERNGYELIGVTGHGYSTSPPISTVTVGFIRKNIYNRTNLNLNINITPDGTLHSVDSYYTNANGSSLFNNDMEIKAINLKVEDAIELTAKRVLATNDYVDDLIVENYYEGNGRIMITYNAIISDVITNMNAQVTVALDDGRIENLYGFKSHIENFNVLIDSIRNAYRDDFISEETARKSIGDQNVILDGGKLYYRYNYGKENKWLWRFDVKTGQRKQWIYIDAVTGEEVNIESYNWDF